ncbi:NB-ARC domain-containing protein [Actinosynnema sp. NPDC050436]|uniref:helix-turn-helix domain-containing protein n=1 Tax=Actinosynnema sp. NPDC050436 TaxID=3155659 RepID=UPI0033FF907F
MEEIDPVGARGSADFVALLRRRRAVAGLSYRQLDRRARQCGRALPPSTTASMLGRSTLPGAELVATFVRACGADAEEVDTWLTARLRILTTALPRPPEPTVPPAPVDPTLLDNRPKLEQPAVTLEASTGSPGDPPGSAFTPPVPQQLPACPAAQVGRSRHLAELDAVVDGTVSPLVVVTGPPGVGKSALAVRWAHRAAHRFPDGRLHLDLADPLPVPSAVAHLLVGLGVPAPAVPDDVRQAVALYRSVVADRRVLVVLDNAGSPDQVRPLRPSAPGSCTLVTSRNRLTALAVHDGAHLVGVPPLARDDAVRLLARAAGDRLVAAEPGAAGAVADLCDGVPLALRVAATVLDPTSDTPLADLVAELRTGALRVLEDRSDVSLTATFHRSYDALDTPSKRLFRLFGTTPRPTITPPTAAAALNVDQPRARTLLRNLTRHHLVAYLGNDRYRVPGLLREYARSRPPVVEGTNRRVSGPSGTAA